MLRRLVPILLILVTASAFAAAEVAVSDFALQTAPGMKRLPSIAAGEGGYLAAWLDDRSWSHTLMVARLSANGEPLDPFGIPLGSAVYFRPQILWNGDGYLVFWNETGGNLMVTHVSGEGIAGTPRVLREHAWLDQRQRAVATNGSHIVLAYNGPGGRMRVAVMTPEAVIIDDRIVDARSGWGPTVIANGPQFLVAWNVAGPSERGDFVALRLDSRGAAIDASPRKIGEGPDAEILRNGSDYVAIAQEPFSESWRVSGDLAQIGEAAPLPVHHYDRDPSLLDGSPAMLAIFESSEKVFVTAVTFDENGHEAGPRKRIVESVPSHFAVARGDGALALIEVRSGIEPDALIGSLFDDATLARKGPERALALSGGEENSPVIAGGAGRYLAVWNGPRGLTAGRFLPDGTRLDDDGFVLDSPADTPSVVFDGERFVVSYRKNIWNGNQLLVRFVSPGDGLLPDVQSIENTPYSSTQASLAVGGGGVIATWMNDDGVYAAALRGTQVIAPARKIADARGGRPLAKWNGRQFLVVWHETEFDWDMEILARLQSIRIGSDLAPVDAQPRLLLDRPVEDPVLAAWKEGWLIAFRDGFNVRLHEIDGDGAMNETPLVTTAGFAPRLVNAVSNPWLAWTSYEENLLHASPVRSDGTLGPDALSIAAPPFGYSFGYATELGSLGNDVAAAYARVAPEAGFVRRAFISVAKATPTRRRAVR